MANKVNAEDLRHYTAETKSWKVKQLVELGRSRSRAWLTAGVMGAVAVVAMLCATALAMRPVDVPVVLRVNDTTGTVDVVQRLKDGDTSYDEVTAKYFTEKYVRSREGFIRDLAEEQYREVGLLSGPAEQQRFYAWFNPTTSPESPLKVYGIGTKARARVKSSSFLRSNVAGTKVLLVRFIREIERPGSEKVESTHWAATVVFKFSSAPMSDSDRRVNPLGFQVLDYRVDPDAASGEGRAPGAPTPAGPAPTPAAPAVTITPAPAPQQIVPAIAGAQS